VAIQPNVKMYRLLDAKNAIARFRAARADAGLSADAAGQLVGLSQPQISRIESGVQRGFSEPVKDKLLKLAEALNVKLDFVDATWHTIRGGTRVQKPSAPPARAKVDVMAPVPARLSSISQIKGIIELTKQGSLTHPQALVVIESICHDAE